MAIAASQPSAVVELTSVDFFHSAGANWGKLYNITFAGYHSAGDGGGGAVYVLGAPGQTDNGGSILCDAAGNCFNATSPVTSILQWGAHGDATRVAAGANVSTSGGITTATLLSGTFSASAVGNPIAVSGAAPIYEQGIVNSGSNLIFNLSFGLNSITGNNFSGPYGIDKGVPITSDSAGALIGRSFTKLSYCLVNTTGSTHGTTTIDSISDTSQMQPGMLVYATGVAAISITAVGANSVTLASAATGSHAGTSISVWGDWCATMNGNATASSTTDTLTLPNGTFYGTIASVNGASAVITVPAGEPAPTNFLASRIGVKVQSLAQDTSTALGGSGFAVGQFVVLNDQGCATSCTAGTVLQVQSVVGSAISVNSGLGGGAGINVFSQVNLNAAPPAQFCSATGISNLCPGSATGTYTVYQSDGVTPVANVGNAVINQKYSKTGQVVYGHDDTAFINAAYSSALPLQNICVPSNRTFIITNTVFLPQGNNSLCGTDLGSSQFELVAPPTPDVNGNTYAGLEANGVAVGGGASYLSFDANMLANFALGIDGGEEEVYTNVGAFNGTTGDVHFGDCDITVPGCVPGVQITSFRFDHMFIQKNFNEFPWFSSHAPFSWLGDKTANYATIQNSNIQGNLIDIEDRQANYNLYLGNVVGGISPYNDFFGYELQGKQIIIAGAVANSSMAAVHLTGSFEKVLGVQTKWTDSTPSTTTYGALIDNSKFWGGAGDSNVVQGVGVQGNLLSSAAQNVALIGGAEPNTWVFANPNATYSQYGAAIPASCSGSPTSGFTVVGGIVTAC
jgi:hypothetical protein